MAVRLADAAGTVAYLSLIFGLLLVFFPASFPRIILNSWQHGNLMPVIMVLTLSLDACLYIHVSYRGCVLRVPADYRCDGSQLSSSRCRRPHSREICRICKLASTRKYSPIPTWDWSPPFFCLSW